MKIWLLPSFAALILAGVATFLISQPVYANTKAETMCQAAYPSDRNLKNACVHGYTTQGPCTPLGGKSLEACQDGAENARLDEATARNEASQNKCGIPATPGSMICWFSRFVGLLTDGLFAALENLLVTPSLDQDEAGGRETYRVWAVFRNIANVVLVIVIMSIIFSQVTNAGINNYGIKKILPRLIVGAILINLSYIVCGLVIDITNIIGNSLKDILLTVALPVKPDFDAWSSIIGIALAGGAGVAIFFNIFALAPIAFSGLIALLMTVIILVARQALLITLVIIAPVAFALNILPSTQKWFGKWWSAFILLACTFPIIAFIFGATRVAAGVISASAPDDPLSTIIFGVFSLGVLSLPFFITPIILKVGGGLLNRFGGIINNPSKGLADRGRKRVEQWSKNKTLNRETNALMGGGSGLYASTIKRRNLKEQVSKHHKSQLKGMSKGAFGNFVSSDDTTRDYLASKAARASGKNIFDSSGSAAQRAGSINDALKNTSLQIEVSEISAAEAVLVSEHNTMDDFKKMAYDGVKKDGTSVTEDEKNAAIKHIATHGNVDDVHKLIDSMGEMQASSTTLRTLADAIDASGISSKAAHLGPKGTQMLRSSGGGNYANTSSLYNRAINGGAYNTETLAAQSSQSLKGLHEQLASPGLISSEAIGSIRANRDLIAKRDKLQGQVAPTSQKYLDKL